MDWGEDRNPSISKTVTSCPGFVVLDRYTMVDWPGVKALVGIGTIDVLVFTMNM